MIGCGSREGGTVGGNVSAQPTTGNERKEKVSRYLGIPFISLHQIRSDKRSECGPVRRGG